MMIRKHRALGALGVAAAVVATVLTGCSAPTSSGDGTATVTQADFDKAMSTPTDLTFWTWVPDIQNQVDLFEKKYPAISVKVENVGQGAAHYQKVRTALTSGEGAPDVIQLEYQYVSSFVQTKSLLDLRPYGADKLSGSYVDWVFNQVKQGDAIYAVPQDSGPMGNLYRSDILAQAGIDAAPATWADYADAAAAVKSKTGSYISNLAPNEPGALLGLLWAAGVKPFGYDGDKAVTIDVNSAESKKVLSYWQDLVAADQVSVDPDFTDGWYQGLANGKYAGWLTAAWGPVFLQGTAKDTSGLWTAAALPQTTAGADSSGNWGGSSDAVLSTTKNPIAAYELARFINADPESTLKFATDQFLFPTLKSTLTDPNFAGQESEFYGGQKVNALFSDVSSTVDTEFQWLPFMDFAYSSFNDTLGKSIADKGDFSAGADAWQDALVEYATQQGFTVN